MYSTTVEGVLKERGVTVVTTCVGSVSMYRVGRLLISSSLFMCQLAANYSPASLAVPGPPSTNMEAVSVSNLTYSHTTADPPSLLDINIHLPRGSRTILVGANGGRLEATNPTSLVNLSS
jgi:hypothetical protein